MRTNTFIRSVLKTVTPISLGTAIVGLGLFNWTGTARAADIVCRGTLFRDTNFAAYYGETGFGRIELQYRRGGSVEVPLQYIAINSRGESLFRGNNPQQPSDVIEVFARSPVRPGTRIRVAYNGNPAFGICSRLGGSRPPSTSTPTAGSFSGKGQASGSVFGRGRPADASLNFNRGNFSVNLAVPPGNRAQVTYVGSINRLQGTGLNNPNSFVLEGRVRSFASSATWLRPINTAGTCQIEVRDARITSVSCKTNVWGSSTQFTGLTQF
jgi:hypothetical protein